jgi:hypothetical protein
MRNFILIRKFCESIKFPKISKDITALQRLDKISIFEYFNFVEERTISLTHQILVKEIVEYIYSNNFTNEFRYTFLNEEKKFKFLLLNIGLVVNRIENSIKEDNLSLKLYIKNLISFHSTKSDYLSRLKIIYYLKFLPLKYNSKDILKYYISKNQIKKKYENNNIIEDEFIKKYTKIDFSFLKIKKNFIADLNNIEDNEEKFKDKYIKNFLLNDSIIIANNPNEKSKPKINESDCDKLLLYFIAHVIYIFIYFRKITCPL